MVYSIHFCCSAVLKGRSLSTLVYLCAKRWVKIWVHFQCLIWHFIWFILSSTSPKLRAGFKGHFLFAELLLTSVGVLCKHLRLQHSPSCPPTPRPSRPSMHMYLCTLVIRSLTRAPRRREPDWNAVPCWYISCQKSFISRSRFRNVACLSADNNYSMGDISALQFSSGPVWRRCWLTKKIQTDCPLGACLVVPVHFFQ